jgi:hypothetical protein
MRFRLFYLFIKDSGQFNIVLNMKIIFGKKVKKVLDNSDFPEKTSILKHKQKKNPKQIKPKSNKRQL